MRFLADECCDFYMVKALIADGNDVLCVRELSPGADDSSVVETALREKRILLTEDKDFGQLIYAHGQGALGVIFMRFPIPARVRIADELVEMVRKIGEGLIGSFVTVQPGKIRIGRIPKE